MEPGITIATDAAVADFVRATQRDLVVLAPAVTALVAEAIADRWRSLGGPAVQVIIDSEPEVYRLGFGDEQGLQILERAAQECGALLRKQPGTRIAIVVSDGQTLIYTPAARLVEAGPNTAGAANAILLGAAPQALAADLGQGTSTPKVGKTQLTSADTERIEASLKENPPQKFDIARRVNVFNSYFEFVELEVLGTQISKQTVQIPNHILGVVDDKTRRQLKTQFRIVPPEDELSGEHLSKDRELIAQQYLTRIPNYGVIVRRNKKEEFVKAVDALKASVDAFSKRLEESLAHAMETQRAHLMDAFLPRLTENPPKEWTPSDGRRPSEGVIRTHLERELQRAFGNPRRLLKQMKVSLLFKGVTYELLTNDDFLKACGAAGLDMNQMHEEYEAARAHETVPKTGPAAL